MFLLKGFPSLRLRGLSEGCVSMSCSPGVFLWRFRFRSRSPCLTSQTGGKSHLHSHVGYRMVCCCARERLPCDREPSTFTVMCQKGRSPFTHKTLLWPKTHRRLKTTMESQEEC